MNKQVVRIPVQQGNALESGDYELGLRVLARLIARIHMERTAKRRVNKDGFPKNKM